MYDDIDRFARLAGREVFEIGKRLADDQGGKLWVASTDMVECRG